MNHLATFLIGVFLGQSSSGSVFNGWTIGKV